MIDDYRVKHVADVILLICNKYLSVVPTSQLDGFLLCIEEILHCITTVL